MRQLLVANIGSLFLQLLIKMEIASEIRKAFQALLQNESFTNNILLYTRSALETIFNHPQTEEVDTPPAFIMLLSHLINTNQSIKSLVALFPIESQASANKLIGEFTSSEGEKGIRVDNSVYNNLCNVEWEMSIESGRQIWEVRLFTFQNPNKPFVLRLNYEQLSILTFQVSQIVNQVMQIEKQ